MRGDSEKDIENHLISATAALGLVCLKFVSPGRRGVPDRMIIGRDNNGHSFTLFVEIKAPGEKPRPDQRAMLTLLRDHGAHALVADSIDAVDALLADYVTTPSIPITERDPHAAPLPGKVEFMIDLSDSPPDS